MRRVTGTYQTRIVGGERVRAFIPHPLPPSKPALDLNPLLIERHSAALTALQRLSVAAMTVPSVKWFLYGFVRKEAVISSQIEGTQATLEDVVQFEATRESEHPEDVEEICNYIAALEFARREINRPKGLPISSRLLCRVHEQLMRGVRGADKQPGTVRTSQNWVGGTRPGNASFVPPPPEEVLPGLSRLDQWIHADSDIPPLIRAGLAHVQFETIHPFLDGNGRIGRLLVSLLLEHWNILEGPLLYLSLSFKRHRDAYYRRLSAVRTDGDWEGWTEFFLDCSKEAADDAVEAAGKIFRLLHEDRQRVVTHRTATVSAIRLFDLLAEHPIITPSSVVQLLVTSRPTALKAIQTLEATGILKELTGRRRDRIFSYQRYLTLLSADTALMPR